MPKNLSGQHFGEITVLEIDQELTNQKSRVYWKCRCSCGREKSIRADGLKKIQSCGECKKDLVGKVFERLTVIKKGKKDKSSHQYYICECQCGNIVEVNGDNLRRGLTRSCGCLHQEMRSDKMKNLTNQKFGQLLVLEVMPHKYGERIQWKCLCDCGTITIVQSNNLLNGHTTSCGCLKSKGEKLLREILNGLNIPYRTEYIFSDLPSRRFDFVIYDINRNIKAVIEYDGIQHYKFINTWHQTEEEWKEALKRDEEKTEYCKKNNIPLIRIPYYDYNKINSEYIQNLINNI